MGRSVWCRVEVNDLLVRPDEAAPSSHAAVINASGIKKKKTNGEACQNISTFQHPITGFALLYLHPSPFSSRLSSTVLFFHLLPCAVLKTMCTCWWPRRGPSFSCQSVNRVVSERQVARVAECLIVLDPCQEHQWHTQPVTTQQRDYKRETLRGLNTQSKASVDMAL